MQKVLLICRQMLSTKTATLIVLLVAVTAKIILQLSIFSIIGDKSFQLVAAQNLVAGNGITVNQLGLENLTTEIYTPLVGWPPGYSLFIAPLLWIFNNDYFSAALFFDLLCVFPFFLFLVRLLDFLAVERWLKNLFILFSGFFFYPVGSSTSTDFAALVAMLAGLYYLLRYMHAEGKRNNELVFACFAFFLAALFRYNYAPVVFGCAILLLIAGYINRNKAWTRGGWKMLLILGTLLTSLLVFQQFYTGSATYVNSPETGFFPGNIQKIYPLSLSSLTDVQVYHTFISKHTGNYDLYGHILFYGSHAISIALLVYGLFILIGQKKLLLKNKQDYFLYAGIGISICIATLLLYLSLRNSAYFSPHMQWTYVEEPRYYIFLIVFIQLCVFVFLFNRFNILSTFWRRVTIACVFIMALGCVHKVYYHAKIMFTGYSSSAYNRLTVPVINLFDEVKQKYPGQDIIVVSPDTDICNYARLQKIKGIYKTPAPDLVFPALAKPTKLIIVIPFVTGENQPAHLSAYYYSQIQKYYFYIQDASPAVR